MLISFWSKSNFNFQPPLNFQYFWFSKPSLQSALGRIQIYTFTVIGCFCEMGWTLHGFNMCCVQFGSSGKKNAPYHTHGCSPNLLVDFYDCNAFNHHR